VCPAHPEVAGKFPEAEAERLLAADRRVRDAVAYMDDDHRDPRIKAAFAIAPVVGAAMNRDSLASIDVPAQIVVGSDD
jgi:predicted dienelactone hydrolase